LIEQIYDEARLEASFSQFIGYAGCSTYEQLVQHLENRRLRKMAKMKIEEVYVSEEAPFLKKISEKYKGLYQLAPKEKVYEMLETNDSQYHSALASKKGCLNSALFCEELAGFMSKKYGDRFSLFEFTPVEKIELYGDKAVLRTKDKFNIKAKKVVLCTNGFESIKIDNKVGKEVDAGFHEFVIGVVGYMAGYVDKIGRKSVAISYFPKQKKRNMKGNVVDESDPYFYITRREYNLKGNQYNLTCIGGPEVHLESKTEYIRDRPYFKKRQNQIDKFLKKTYIYAPNGEIPYKFRWHGLMGYTKSGLRIIGPDPCNNVLLFNLGCNGVGILPSIYGGFKIARFISGIKMRPSIFDPKI